METVDRIDIHPSEKHKFQLEIHTAEKDKTVIIDDDELQNLVMNLIARCEILNVPDTYQAYLYENDVEDFSLKFYFLLELKDFTYIAIKGLHPFRQPHYHDLIDVFLPYFEK